MKVLTIARLPSTRQVGVRTERRHLRTASGAPPVAQASFGRVSGGTSRGERAGLTGRYGGRQRGGPSRPGRGFTLRDINVRQAAYFALVGLRGQRLGGYYRQMLREDRQGIAADTTRRLLADLLAHCERSVPYYAQIMGELGGSYTSDPEAYLQRFPILTKDIIRSHFEELISRDLDRRHWFYNTSGGSTGEPVRLIQDRDYAARSGAVKLLFSKLVGGEIGRGEVRLWGSARDITGASDSLRARFVNRLTGTTFLSVFELTPQMMRRYIAFLNARRPGLIVAYAGAMYELARLAEREQLDVVPQSAIITSATTLYPFMRETIERVFGCRVYNRYGSREVGDIACERPGWTGLWVAPWGNYLEIVDSSGRRVPDGQPGDILVTSLTNYAMPLIRYRIEDRGVLRPANSGGAFHGQVLESVLGRTYDMFVNRHGVLVEGGHFMALLYFRDWIAKYQVIQPDCTHIVFRFVTALDGPQPGELDELRQKTCAIMHDDVDVTFEFVDDIAPTASGKHRFIISEVSR